MCVCVCVSVCACVSVRVCELSILLLLYCVLLYYVKWWCHRTILCKVMMSSSLRALVVCLPSFKTMCVYVCVCVCVCVHIHTWIYVHIYLHLYTQLLWRRGKVSNTPPTFGTKARGDRRRIGCAGMKYFLTNEIYFDKWNHFWPGPGETADVLDAQVWSNSKMLKSDFKFVLYQTGSAGRRGYIFILSRYEIIKGYFKTDKQKIHK